MDDLLSEIRQCKVCEEFLPLGCNPVLAAHKSSKIIIIGQAPGSVVHQSGVPWDDKSGGRLREWLQMDKTEFYDPTRVALIPMGFCYPGKGKSGDLPPRPECAPLWHPKLMSQLNSVSLTLLIGEYAQRYYLGDKRKNTLTETVRNFKEYLPEYLVLPHPSPRNNIWLKKNPWFEEEVLPALRRSISS
ncbi:MAG: uracil-DNA glycosylase family protein [Bacteroidota bacterium]